MKSLLIYLKDYKKESVLAPLFKMLEATFELLVPLVMAAVIDVGIANSDRPYIVKMCFVLIALGLIGLVCSITAQYFSAKAAAGFGTGVRHALFEHIQKLTFTEMDTIGSSTLITRLTSDINQTQSGVNLVLRLFLRSPFIVFGAMIMAFTVDVKAAVIFVIVIPVLSVIVFGVMLVTMPLYRKVQSCVDRVLLTTRENLAGVREIRAFNKEQEEREKFGRENQILTDAQKFVGRISGLMSAPGQRRGPDAGRSRSPDQLYVADPDRAGQARQPDHYSDQGGRLRQQDRECAEHTAGYERRRPDIIGGRYRFRNSRKTGRTGSAGCGVRPCLSDL